MTKRMLIDATDAEETRVVVLDGTRLEEFDVETSTKKQLKGNIYLAKVIRVEPSLQAAFIEYGGNRHGFLAFGEIHPDYYQIPVADRQRLIAAQVEEARLEEEEEDRAAAVEAAGGHYEREERGGAADRHPEDAGSFEPDAPPADARSEPADDAAAASDAAPEAWESEDAVTDSFGAEPIDAEPIDAEPIGAAPSIEHEPNDGAHDPAVEQAEPDGEPEPVQAAQVPHEQGPHEHDHDHEPGLPEHDRGLSALDHGQSEHAPPDDEQSDDEQPGYAQPARIQQDLLHGAPETDEVIEDQPAEAAGTDATAAENGRTVVEPAVELLAPETVGGEPDTVEDARDRRIPPKFLRNYKIQEVIKRRQILLVQVVKEERGTKGAALTTYLSLAGRFCVLMPNSPRGGGISRKITSAADRKRLKEITSELEIPSGMGLIVRTAGANRPRQEIRRDCEYLLRLWDDIREHTMQSVAPALIYEEANLIKRAIRDVYSRDVDEIMVDGTEAWQAARNFMNMLMPSHVRKVVLHTDDSAGGGLPLFAKHQVDAQLDAMLSPTVQLKSGGYLVINQAEALVAIDVNSGRSTRERNIEETALRTNLEAADEVARQLRLRDLAGLIVIDFIDMEAKKHNAMVERRMKDALKNDRARIQVGHISHFGLLEMSRQRLRPSLSETNFVTCPHCAGLGLVRGTESAAIHVLRGIEEEAAKQRAAEIMVNVAGPVLMYLVNHKRDRVAAIERRYAMRVLFGSEPGLSGTQMRIDRLRAQLPREPAREDAGPVAMIALPQSPMNEVAYEADPVDMDDEFPADEPRVQASRQVAGAVASARPSARGTAPNGAGAGGSGPEIEAGGEAGAEAERTRRRRRRRRRGGRREDGSPAEAGGEDAAEGEAAPQAADGTAAEDFATDAPPAAVSASGDLIAPHTEAEATDASADASQEPGGETSEETARRKRSRRGGRRRRRDAPEDAGLPAVVQPGSDQPELPAYVGPTPADPFAGQSYDIFDVMDEAETRAAEQLSAANVPAGARPAAARAPRAAAARLAVRPAPARSVIAPMAPLADVAPTAAAVPATANGDAQHADAAEAPAEPDELTDQIEVAAPEPEPEVEPESEPAIKPIMVGPAPLEERKRGWWRR